MNHYPSAGWQYLFSCNYKMCKKYNETPNLFFFTAQGRAWAQAPNWRSLKGARKRHYMIIIALMHAENVVNWAQSIIKIWDREMKMIWLLYRLMGPGRQQTWGDEIVSSYYFKMSRWRSGFSASRIFPLGSRNTHRNKYHTCIRRKSSFPELHWSARKVAKKFQGRSERLRIRWHAAQHFGMNSWEEHRSG